MDLIWYFGIIAASGLGLYFVRKSIGHGLFTIVYAAAQIAFTLLLYKFPLHFSNPFFKADALAILFISVLTITSVFSIINSFVYFNKRNEKLFPRSIYFASLIFLFGCITGVFLSDNIGLIWVFTEATTLCIAVLIYHERTPETVEATWKYVFISAIGLSFTFIGILLLDVASQGLDFASLTFSSLAEKGIVVENRLLFQISFLLIIVGYSVKMGLFPFYTVCVDARTVAPSPISAILSTSLMNVGIVAVIRFYSLFAATELHGWINNVLLILGFLSLLFSAVYMFRVKNVKRLIAYSSVENMGLVCIALAAGTLGHIALILHLILHSFLKAGLFLQSEQLIRLFQTKKIYGMAGYVKHSPIGGLVFLGLVLCMMGVPPSGLFFTKFMILTSLFSEGLSIIGVISLMLIILIAYIFSRNMIKILFASDNELVHLAHKRPSAWESAPQLLLLLLALFIGLNPPAELMNLVQAAVAIIPS